MQFKKGQDWKACFDEEADRYTAECGDFRNYDLYEITKEIYDSLIPNAKYYDAAERISRGRHLYMAVDDRCGPPYTIVFDRDYKALAPWAFVVSAGEVWSDGLTDAAVEVLDSEQQNRAQRKARREQKPTGESDGASG